MDALYSAGDIVTISSLTEASKKLVGIVSTKSGAVMTGLFYSTASSQTKISEKTFVGSQVRPASELEKTIFNKLFH